MKIGILKLENSYRKVINYDKHPAHMCFCLTFLLCSKCAVECLSMVGI